MFIIELIKAFKNREEKEKEIPVRAVDINKLPKESQEWIRRIYNTKNRKEEP